MPRPLRTEYEGAWYHVMNRGACRQAIFKHDEHRHAFLSFVREANLYYNVECHGFCLMGNHYHLLIHTPLGNLSEGMRHISANYTQYFNRTEKRDGPLFRGRYKSILVKEDGYLLCVSRYIHLNPVEAKMIRNPEDYKWSSYQSYTTLSLKFPWLKTNMILEMMSHTNQQNEYQAFVKHGIDEKTQAFYHKKRTPVIMDKCTFG